MGDCQNGGLLSAKTLEFVIVALLKSLLPLESICYCALWKIMIILFHPPWAGLWEVSAQKKQGPVHLPSYKQLGRRLFIYNS